MVNLLALIGFYVGVSLFLGALYGLVNWLRNRPKRRLRVVEGGKPLQPIAPFAKHARPY